MDADPITASLLLLDIPNVDDVHENISAANKDPFKFSHGLTGVNQPANYLFVNILIGTALIPIILTILSRVIINLRNDRRRVAAITSCRNADFWRKDRYAWWGNLKRHFLYAPFWTIKKDGKENKQATLSRGTKMTRPQVLIIAVYISSNAAYCVAIPRAPKEQMVAELRGRCGALAAFNLMFTILFAIRNNPLIHILHVSYDTFNLFHRWAARLVVFESIIHVLAFAYNTWSVEYEGQHGWHSILWVIQHSLSYQWAAVACSAFLFLILHSIGVLRHTFYDTFLTLHRLGVIVALAGAYYHLAKHALPQLPWIYVSIMTFALEPVIRAVRILCLNSTLKPINWTRISLETLPGEATRITMHLPRAWKTRPGSHIHVYLPRLAFWTSHPFSIAWTLSNDYTSLRTEKLPLHIDDISIRGGPTTVACIVRARSGMTRALYNMASCAGSEAMTLWGAIEGPYGGYHSLDSYGTVLLFAAGVGITHQLDFVRHLLTGNNQHTAATQKILLIWCIPNAEAISWVSPWLKELSGTENFDNIVRIQIFISRMKSSESSPSSPSEGVQIRLEKCDVQKVIDEEVLAQKGAMAVTVCGPSRFNECVRTAVRRRVCIRSIDFIEESFSY